MKKRTQMLLVSLSVALVSVICDRIHGRPWAFSIIFTTPWILASLTCWGWLWCDQKESEP